MKKYFVLPSLLFCALMVSRTSFAMKKCSCFDSIEVLQDIQEEFRKKREGLFKAGNDLRRVSEDNVSSFVFAILPPVLSLVTTSQLEIPLKKKVAIIGPFFALGAISYLAQSKDASSESDALDRCKKSYFSFLTKKEPDVVGQYSSSLEPAFLDCKVCAKRKKEATKKKFEYFLKRLKTEKELAVEFSKKEIFFYNEWCGKYYGSMEELEEKEYE